MTNKLEVKHLSYQEKNATILNDLTFSIPEGSYVSIAGTTGSGKTTLIKLIGGILPSRDAITIGFSYIESSKFHDHAKELGIVFGSEVNCFLFEDVYKELAFPLENLNVEESKIEKRILELAKHFKITKLLDKKTTDLTNSERQVLLIVLSLLHAPQVLLLDDVFSMMDNKTKQQIKKSLKEYQQKNNLTILLTTVNLEDTLDTDYLYIMNKGDIVLEGSPLTVLKEDKLLGRLGFSLPFMVDLSLKLKFYELLSEVELDMNRMVDTLWK